MTPGRLPMSANLLQILSYLMLLALVVAASAGLVEGVL